MRFCVPRRLLPQIGTFGDKLGAMLGCRGVSVPAADSEEAAEKLLGCCSLAFGEAASVQESPAHSCSC